MESGTRLLTGGDGQSYEFDPGCLCLELLLTGGPEPCDRFEILHRPGDLADWLLGSRLAATAPLDEVEIRVRPRELLRLKAFRDRMWTIAAVLAAGGWPSTADLAVVNDSVGAQPVLGLDPESGERTWLGPVTGEQVLAAAAREVVDLLGTGLADRVRECEASDCRLLFVDTSRPGKRRWCSMKRCGNRHKVQAYRARQHD
ncbi:CGNR zinc finger domain-containing protein [Amycolatopsis sp. CA-230715]|uniref:CGNR zinc finger domain-containing protein n=1 Tax=Amycolatopsis sp. CA-230715 TaxID=2745196 RepID=UPI001C02B0B9|nr:CGNR zinc finger domain-containing protein [Amycolatopsis sp. CA-230715]QWF79971.1 hypothetical protein HUW46_03384 [Amycolatopsis sp. CA-230715]